MLLNMNQLTNIAESFYRFFKLGDFAPAVEDIAELTMDEAYECQRIYEALRVSSGDEPCGYKVGCTSAAIQKQFGFNDPIFGRLMNPGIITEGADLKSNDYFSLAIEPELVLTLNRDLCDVDCHDDDLLAAIDCVQRQELICSNGLHAGQIIGQKKVDAGKIDWALEGVAVFVNGKLVASGVAADIMEGPLNSLRCLIRHLAKRNGVLRAGEMVIPGSATQLISVHAGDEVTCSFTNGGSVTTVFN
jgi:2-keto-4-pentenoate hydratase